MNKDKTAIWGYDGDGDFALKIGDKVYSFYKWANPTILTGKDTERFVPLNDSNSKDVWKKVSKAYNSLDLEENDCERKSVILKTWEEFEKLFKPICNKWNEYDGICIRIEYKHMHWEITPEMKEAFGKKIFVKEKNVNNYTHQANINGEPYLWHELWFKS